MKGLLLKDFYAMDKTIKIFIAIILLFAVIGETTYGGEALYGFAIVYAAMLPMMALSFDERSKWDTLAAMMPYLKRDLVLSKYVLGYIFVLAASILSLATHSVTGFFKGTGPGAETVATIALLACIATIMLALNLPFMFKFGVEKGRFAFLFLVAVVILIVMRSAGFIAIALTENVPSLSFLVGIAVVAAILINLISIRFSLHFYKTRSA